MSVHMRAKNLIRAKNVSIEEKKLHGTYFVNVINRSKAKFVYQYKWQGSL